MPKIETWGNLPLGVRQHLIDRMRDRAISIADLNQLRIWIDSNPKCRKAIGTRTSVRSRSAATAQHRRRSCGEAKPPRVRPSNLAHSAWMRSPGATLVGRSKCFARISAISRPAWPIRAHGAAGSRPILSLTAFRSRLSRPVFAVWNASVWLQPGTGVPDRCRLTF